MKLKRNIEELLGDSMRRTDAVIKTYKSELYDQETKQIAYDFAVKKELKLINFLVKKSHKIKDPDDFYTNYANIIFGNLMVIKRIATGKIDKSDIAFFYITARQYNYFKGAIC